MKSNRLLKVGDKTFRSLLGCMAWGIGYICVQFRLFYLKAFRIGASFPILDI